MGILIALEGTDGSGKKTQTDALVSLFGSWGMSAAALSFPRYGDRSAELVERYLNDEFGDASEVDPYLTSIFYAIDRRESKEEIKALQSEHDIVVLDRYIDSNAGHQGSKISNEQERGVYLDWLYQTEFDIFGIPKPDLVIVLHVPAEVSFELIESKAKRDYIKAGKTRDAHEGNLKHLQETEATYLWLAEQHPEVHRVVSCVDSEGAMLSPEEITFRIAKLLSAEGIAKEKEVAVDNTI